MMVLFKVLLIVSFFSVGIDAGVCMKSCSCSPVIVSIRLGVSSGLILSSSLRDSPFFPAVLGRGLECKFRGVGVSSGGTSVSRRGGIFLFPGRCIRVRFFETSALNVKRRTLTRCGSVVRAFPNMFDGEVPSHAQSDFKM